MWLVVTELTGGPLSKKRKQACIYLPSYVSFSVIFSELNDDAGAR